MRKLEQSLESALGRIAALERDRHKQPKKALEFPVITKPTRPKAGVVLGYARGAAGAERLYQQRSDGTETAL